MIQNPIYKPDGNILTVGQVCTKCGQSKPLNEFTVTRRDGRNRQCKRCRLDVAKEWRRLNPEKAASKRAHAYQAWRIKHPRLPPQEPIAGPGGRLCRSCDVRKTNAEFRPDHRAKDGLAWRCRDCMRADHSRWSDENRERVRDNARHWARKKRASLTAEQKRHYQQKIRLKTKYGITIEEFYALAASQGGKCPICTVMLTFKASNQKGDRRTHLACVDHDHKTGRVRSILCNRCNRGIGMFDDDRWLLERAVAYLTEHSND